MLLMLHEWLETLMGCEYAIAASGKYDLCV